MKKKIINGILLVAMLFATSSAFVSCKDNDADVSTELKGQYSTLKAALDALQSKVDGIKSCNCDMTSINNAIAALQQAVKDLENGKPVDLSNYVTNEALAKALAEAGFLKSDALADYLKKGDLDLSAYATNEGLKAALDAALKDYAKTADVNETIAAIKATIEGLDSNIAADVKGMVTGINVEATYNNIFGTLSLPGFRPNILGTWIGQTTADVLFPAADIANGAKQEEFEAGQSLVNLNAGTVYMSVNPSTVDLEGKEFTLVNSQNVEAPVIFPLVTESEKVLAEGWTRSDNGLLYEADAIIDPARIQETYPAIDFKTLTDDIKTVAQKRNGEAIQKLVLDIYGQSGQITPRYAVKSAWEGASLGAMSATSAFDVNVISIKPLAYTFRLNITKTPGIDRIEKFIDNLIDKIKLKLNVNIPKNVKIEIKAINLNQQKITVALTVPEQTITVNGVTTTIPANPISTEVDITAQMQSVVNDLLSSLNNSLADVNNILANVQELANVGVQIENMKTSIKSDIHRYLDAFDKRFVNLVNNSYKALQPTLFVKADGKLTRARGEIKAGKISLVPTSWTAEMFAPAYRKFLVVANDKSANTGYLGQVLTGNVNEVEMTIEKGKTYDIIYSAMDYFGNVVTNEYSITGK